jgi:LacI family transcriptional regulator
MNKGGYKQMVQFEHTFTSDKQVAVIIESSNGYDKGLLKGIKQYAQENQRWSIYMSDSGSDLSWLSNWKGKGVLARIETKELADSIEKLNLPTVSLTNTSYVPDLPYAVADDVLTVHTAAEFLLERGLQTFTTFCEAKQDHANGIYDYFQAYLADKGYSCETFFSAYAGRSEIEKKIRIARWLGELPKPIGVFACSQTELLLEACQLAGYSISDEVTIIGFNQELILCELLDRQLSTVILNSAKSGYFAASLLNQMMDEFELKKSKSEENTERPHTETMVRKDKIVSDALEFIHSNACYGITVIDVLSEIPLSRRVLEHRFRKVLGKTPHEEIISARLKRVKQLLSETNLTLGVIADRAGFKHTEYLSVAFKREIGLSPSQYRKLNKRNRLTVNY